MKKLMMFILSVCCICVSSEAIAQEPVSGDPAAIPSPQNILAADGFLKTYIVTIDGDFLQVEQIRNQYSLDIGHNFQYSVNGFSTELDRDKHAALSRDPRVSEIYEDFPTAVTATQELEVVDGQRPTWGLDRINQRDLPLDAMYSYQESGNGISVYVIDTGINPSHQEFSGRVSDGFSVINDGNETNDCNGHGTHVAGIIGAQTYGVAKSVELIPVRVLSCTASGTTANLLAGIEWMINHHDERYPAVANLSLSRSFSAVVNSAIDSAIGDNISVVVGAGNNSRDACLYSPSSATGAITVAASNQADSKITSSNFGSCVDLFAPGADIVSTWKDTQTGLRSLSGTSMASPHVAGVAAMLLEADNSLSPMQVHETIISMATEKEVLSSGLNSPNLILYNGSQILNEQSEAIVVAPETTTTSSTSTTTTTTTTTITPIVPTASTTSTSSTTSTTSTTLIQQTTTTSSSTTIPHQKTTSTAPIEVADEPNQEQSESFSEETVENIPSTTTTTTTLAPSPTTVVEPKSFSMIRTPKFCRKAMSVGYFSRVKHICALQNGSLKWVLAKQKKLSRFKI